LGHVPANKRTSIEKEGGDTSSPGRDEGGSKLLSKEPRMISENEVAKDKIGFITLCIV